MSGVGAIPVANPGALQEDAQAVTKVCSSLPCLRAERPGSREIFGAGAVWLCIELGTLFLAKEAVSHRCLASLWRSLYGRVKSGHGPARHLDQPTTLPGSSPDWFQTDPGLSAHRSSWLVF